MSLKSVKTLTAAQLAKKWDMSLDEVKRLIAQGAAVEKEHTKSHKDALEIARDHLSERPDYYKKLAKLEKTKITKEGMSTEPERDSETIGDYTGSSRKVMKVDEVKIPPKVKKAAATGMTLANLATLGQVAGDAAEGRKGSDPKRGLVAATSTLPGPVGWGATGLNYTIKGYDKAREHLRAKVKQMKEEKSIDEATFQGKKVPLNKPMKGDVKKSKVFVDPDGDGKAQKVNFGDPNMTIKKSNPARRKSFRARHNCDNPGPNTKARYWSCKAWEETQIKEVAMAMPPAVQPPAVVGQQVPGVKRQAPRPTETSGRTGGRMAGQSGSMSARPNVKVSSGVQPSIERSWSRTGTSRMGTGGGSMSASPTKVGTSFSQGGVNVGKAMGASRQTSPVVKGMTAAGRDAATLVSKAAPAASRIAGTALRVAGGPAATAAAAVMSPTPAGAGEDEKKRQETLKSYNPYKAQGRSIADYEKQVLSPSKEKTNTTPAQGSTKNIEPVKGASINPDRSPKVDAPTPPSRPEYFSRGQAFQAARSETGGAGGKFSYGGSEYQTNVKGEPYAAKPKQTSVTDMKEETKMDTKELINEALDDILDNNLVNMKENFLAALQEKAMERLEEKKKEIASNYFAQ